jgi:hypothetical protein
MENLRRSASRSESVSGVSRKVPDMVVTLKGLGPEVSMVEPDPHKRPAASPPARGRILAAAGVAVLFILGGIWYVRGGAVTSRAVAGSTASDVTAIASAITSNSATITWTSAAPSTSQVEFGTTAAYGTLSAFDSSAVTSHSVTLTGLTPGKTYYFAALSTDSAGKVSTSANSTFATGGAAATTETTKISRIDDVTAGGITTDSAAITWTTDQPSSSQVAYGLTTAYGSLSAFGSAPVNAHSVRLTGLSAGTTYSYVALSTNDAGQITSPNFTFTTANSSGIRVIGAAAARDVTPNSATIKWTTDQPSTSQVEFGTTTAFGSLSAFDSSATTSHSVTLTGLTPGTIYHAAGLSTNAAVQIGTPDVIFTTAAAPPLLSQVRASGLTTTSARITWTTDQPTTSKVGYGTTTAYGSLSAANPALTTSHSVTLRGLSPGTTYNYSATSMNAAGMQNSSPNFVFTVPAR